MLFKKAQWQGIADGTIAVAYRRWTRPTVKQGGRLRTPLCMLAIDEVTKLPKSARITNADAQAAGFASAAALKAILAKEGDLYRVRFHPSADGDARETLRARVATSDDEVADLTTALAKLDGKKPWTLDMLALLAARPATRAAELAASVKRETLEFKDDVRKLKALGLTESLDVGYRLSARGAAWLERARPEAVAAARARRAGPRLPDDVVAALSRWKIVGVRSGDTHRFVGVWPVVVDGRLYVRSWSATDGGWWRAFAAEPNGAIHVVMGGRGAARVERTLDVRATRVTDAAVLAAIDTEYQRKFATKGALAYVRDLCAPKSRATTTELGPR